VGSSRSMDPASAATTPTVRGPSAAARVVRLGGDMSLPAALPLPLPLPLMLWTPLPLMLPPPLPKLESLWRPLLTPAAARPLMGLRVGVMPLPFTQNALRDGALARSTRCGLVLPPVPNVLGPRAWVERPADTRTGVPGLRRVGVPP